MARAIIAIVIALSTFTIVLGQPIHCNSDTQCQSNYYCVQDAFICRECLNCEELNREPPQEPSSCVKVTCGRCKNGLVEDRSDLSAACVLPDYTHNTTTWWWWVVGIGVVIVVLVSFVVLYLWYYIPNIGPKIFNRIQEVIDFPATSTSVQHACNPGAPAPGDEAPSAPDCPPPYYESTLPLSGNPVYLGDYDAQNNGEVLDPFIKRAPSTRLPEVRESAGSEAALMYNKPHYVRGPHLPYDNEAAPETGAGASAGTGMGTATAGAGAGAGAGADDDERDAFALDEDTMEFLRAARRARAAARGAPAATDMSAMLAAARNTTVLRPRQDTNNNRNGSDPIGSSEGGASSISCPVIINVVQTIGSLQQTNKFTH